MHKRLDLQQKLSKFYNKTYFFGGNFILNFDTEGLVCVTTLDLVHCPEIEVVVRFDTL